MHRDGKDALLVFVVHLLVLGDDVTLHVKVVLVDIGDVCLCIGEDASLEAEIIVVFVLYHAVSRLLCHLSAFDIAIAIVSPMGKIGVLQLAVLQEVHELFLCHGILCDNLLHRSMKAQTDSILVEGCVGEIEYTDIA